jgi:hypothetical protein
MNTKSAPPEGTSPQTSRGITKPHRRDSDFPNEKDEQKLMITRCNRSRQWSWLQCVRDEECRVVVGAAAAVKPVVTMKMAAIMSTTTKGEQQRKLKHETHKKKYRIHKNASLPNQTSTKQTHRLGFSQRTISSQTSRSITKPHREETTFPNEKDVPKMTIKRCNRRRQWSYL